MLFLTVTSHQNVVEVAKRTGDVPEHGIHEALEGLCCVPQPKWHPQKLEEAKWSDYGSGYRSGKVASLSRR